MRVIGIDIGLKGALVIRDKSGIVKCFKMPVKDNTLDLKVLMSFIDKVKPLSPVAYIEKQHPYPKQGVSSVFKLGWQEGVIEAMLYSQGIKYELVPPKRWQKYFGLRGKKQDIDKAYKIVKKKFKYLNFKTKRGRLIDGFVDACLIMLYGEENEKKKKKNKE